MTRPTTWFRAAVALTILTGLAAWAPPPAPPAGDPTDRAPVERRAGDADFAPRFREFLTQRIEDLRARLDRLERAQAALDEGGSIRQLLADMAPEDRRAFDRPFDQRGPGPNGPNGFGPGAPDRQGSDALDTEPAGPPPTSEEVRAFIKASLPELDENIARVEQMTPKGAEGIVRSLTPRIAEVMLAEQRDEQLGRYKLEELKIGLLVIDSVRRGRHETRASGVTPEFEASFRSRLIELLTLQAEARERVQVREIELLEQRVLAMRNELESRPDSRVEEIEQVADRMIRRMNAPRGRRPTDSPSTDSGPESPPSDD